MYASVVTAQAHPEQMEEGIRVWKETAVNEKGFKWGYMIGDRKTGRFMTFNLWETEEDARAYETSGDFQKDVARFAAGLVGQPTREVFEVVAQK